MNKELQILILEDRAVDAELILFELRQDGLQFQARRVWTEADFVAELARPAYDLILADYSLPDFNGISALKLAQAARPELPFLLVSGSLGEELAVEALHNGATDYLMKQRPARLGPAVRRALREVAERNRRQQAEEEARRHAENYREIFNATQEAIFVHDADTGEIMDVNQTMLDMFGYTRENLSQLMSEGFPSTEPYTHQEALRRMRLAVTEGPQVFEWLNRKKSGETFWSEVTLRATRIGGEGRVLAVVRDISERRRAEEVLRESEEKYRAMVETTNTGYLILDACGKVLDANQSYVKLTGHDALAEIFGRSVSEWTAPHDLERNADAVEKCTAQGFVRNLEIDYLNRRGEITPVEINATIVGSGGSARILSLCRDITERKRAEAALRESQTRFQQVAEHVGEWVWEVDADGLYTYASPVGEKIHGHRPEELVGKLHFYDLFPAEQREELKQAALGCFSRELPFAGFKNHCLHKDGHLVLVETNGTPLLDAQGNLLGYRGVDSDITQRERAEVQIREQASLLDLTQDAIMVRDMEGRIQFWNQGATNLYGWTTDEALGRKVTDLIWHDPEALSGVMEKLLQTAQWAGEAQQLSKRDTREIIVSTRWTLVRDPLGQPKSVLIINTDITEKKKIEAQFLRAQRLESIGQLAGGIAHDLNNILAPIMMIVPLLRDELKNPATLGLLDTVAQSAQRGADIIKQILTFSRGLTSEKVPVQTRHLLKEVGKIAEETFPRSIQIKTRVPNDLWLVQGDATQLHQVLMNLVVNARDAMPNGGVLTLSAQNIVVDEALAGRFPGAKPGPHVRWLVSDTGTGISAKVQDRMFDPFFSTKPQGQGTGLGLSTTLGIVQGHGGFLQVESRLGEGTNFHVYLPAQQEPELLIHQPTVVFPDGKGDLVLVVDDEESIRSVLQHTLEKSGFKVVSAVDGVEAIAILQRGHREIALVIVDLMMPRLDGIAVIREAQRLDPALRIIAASGLCDDAQSTELQNLKVAHFLRKPYTATSLATTLQACLAEGVNI